MILTYRFRVKDKHSAELNRQAGAVNIVWNFCNETQIHALKWWKKWPTEFDLQKLAAGSSKLLQLHASTIDRVCTQYTESRVKTRKCKLRWRGEKSLGWVPFGHAHLKFKNGSFYFRKKQYDVWLSRDMGDVKKLRCGNFSQDSSGNWYLNVMVDVKQLPNKSTSVIGIDLGLKTFATTSNGETFSPVKFYQDAERKIASAQRAKKRALVNRRHLKVKNKRKDFLHKLSTNIATSNGAIFVGDINSHAMVKTSMAKSVYNAGWYAFKMMLGYKAVRHQVLFAFVDEKFSTQTCSSCGSIGGPSGLNGLRIREWVCDGCGAVHDRDINSARNILRCGLASLAEGAANMRSSQDPLFFYGVANERC